jgi:hypothetical protein
MMQPTGTGAAPDQFPCGAQDVFWNWLDALLFVGLVLPSIMLSVALTHGILLFARSTPSEALRAMTFQFLAYGIWFSSLWAMLRFRYDRPFWVSMGWTIPWPRMGLTVVVGPALVFTVMGVGQLLNLPPVDSAVERLLTDRWSVALVGAFAVTLGPLAEELAFRGFLQPLLIKSLGTVAGIAVACLPFALLHGPQYAWNWQHLVLLFVASAVFGVTRHWTRSTAASTLVHAAYNFTFFAAYVTQRKELFL